MNKTNVNTSFSVYIVYTHEQNKTYAFCGASRPGKHGDLYINSKKVLKVKILCCKYTCFIEEVVFVRCT